MSKSSGFLSGLILLTAIGVSGCGEIAYKTGEGAESLEADRNACKQGGNDAAGYLGCMRGKGWTIADLNGGDTSAGVSDAPTLKQKSGGDVLNAPPSAEAPQTQVAAPTPPGRIRIQGWVRFGGGSPGDDIANCVATLGPANRPDTDNHIVTKALLACMREKGWRAL